MERVFVVSGDGASKRGYPFLSESELASDIRAQIEAANRGCRQRTVSPAYAERWAARILSNEIPCGKTIADGGSVSNSYKYRATSTKIAIWWWTRGDGQRFVRVSASRGDAGHVSGGSSGDVSFGPASPRAAWSSVFSGRAAKLREAWARRTRRKLRSLGMSLGTEYEHHGEIVGTWSGGAARAVLVSEQGGSGLWIACGGARTKLAIRRGVGEMRAAMRAALFPRTQREISPDEFERKIISKIADLLGCQGDPEQIRAEVALRTRAGFIDR